MGKLVSLIVVAWLAIGVFAAYQRDYFTENLAVNCKTDRDTALTVAAGPLNYFDINAKVQCPGPRPSTT